MELWTYSERLFMAKREELNEVIARCFYDKNIKIGIGGSLTLLLIALYSIITYPFWLIRIKVRIKL